MQGRIDPPWLHGGGFRPLWAMHESTAGVRLVYRDDERTDRVPMVREAQPWEVQISVMGLGRFDAEVQRNQCR